MKMGQIILIGVLGLAGVWVAFRALSGTTGVAYYKDKHTQSLAAGTLVPDFDEEVEKSWKEYTDQVDDEILANNTFFNDALNEILAEGQSVFTLEG